MAGKALPLLLLGAGALFVIGGKKKKRREKPIGGSCASFPPSVHAQKESEGLVCDYDTGEWVPKGE